MRSLRVLCRLQMILVAVSLSGTNVPKPGGQPEERRVPILTQRKGDLFFGHTVWHVVS